MGRVRREPIHRLRHRFDDLLGAHDTQVPIRYQCQPPCTFARPVRQHDAPVNAIATAHNVTMPSQEFSSSRLAPRSGNKRELARQNLRGIPPPR